MNVSNKCRVAGASQAGKRRVVDCRSPVGIDRSAPSSDRHKPLPAALKRAGRPEPAVTPEQADEAVHDLLHTIDPKNHRPIQCRARNGGRVQGYAINHEMEVVMTSTGHYALASVFVAFEPRECVVSYYRKAVRWTNDDPGPDVPREELVPDKPVAAIPYDDPELLEKVYDALARLKVKVPRTLRPKIKQRQAELTKAASTPTNNRLRKCNAKSKH